MAYAFALLILWEVDLMGVGSHHGCPVLQNGTVNLTNLKLLSAEN